MRFTTAWASVSAQNVTLKGAVTALGLVTVTLSWCLAKLTLRDPLIIERACYSSSVPLASAKRTAAEIEAFIREALPQRFDSDAVVKEGYLSAEERQFREQEQAELKKRDMTQKVVLRGPINADANPVSVDADRIISVGKIRSAFVFPITVTLAQTSRSDGNPYGLLIERVATTTSEETGHVDNKGK